MLAKGQLTVEEARSYIESFPETALRSTYIDDVHGKMPVEYETLEEALADTDRYGSVWLWVPGNDYPLQLDPDK